MCACRRARVRGTRRARSKPADGMDTVIPGSTGARAGVATGESS